jgi:gluconate 2-dehydrogenase gamma chain
MADPSTEDNRRHGISRRLFLKGSGAAVVVAGVATAGVACDDKPPDASNQGVATYTKSAETFYNQNSPAPPASPTGDVLNFFTPDEADTIDAFIGRILPGSPEDPGAREANVLAYIDYKLSVDQGFAEPTFLSAPFAQTYEGDTPPSQPAGQTPRVIYVKKDELKRYGRQTVLTPRELYRSGVQQLDAYCQSKFGKRFKDLSEDQQDGVVGDMADGKISGATSGPQFFAAPTDKDFFKEVRTDVVNGMFSDPSYGGNKDMVGYKLISYPGAQRAYTAQDLLAEQTRPPQSIAQLEAFHAGQDVGPNTILPVSSSSTTQYQPSHSH